jgi:signal transduction histidine kinase
MKFHKVSQRLTMQLLTGFGIAVFGVGLLLLGLTYQTVQADLQWQVERRATSITQEIQFATEGLLEVGYTSMLGRIVSNYATLPDIEEVALVSPEGQILAHNLVTQINQAYTTTHPQLAAIITQAIRTGQGTNQRIVVDGTPAVIAISPFRSRLFGTRQDHGLAIATLSLEALQRRAWQSFWRSIITLAIAIAAILGAMGILIQRVALDPLAKINRAIVQSQTTGEFALPPRLPNNEIRFLALTLEQVFQTLSRYEQLQIEITQRRKAEAELLESEQRERAKSQELAQTLKRLQTTQLQLIQTEKMSSLGQMVAGITHEFNNAVNVIHGNLTHLDRYKVSLINIIDLYGKYHPEPHPEIQDLLEAEDLDFMTEDIPRILQASGGATKRIRNIVDSLRRFSRLDESVRKSVNIHDGIEDTLVILKNRLIQAQSNHPIQIIKQYGEIPLVECYPSQLNQVFLTLINNGIDALQQLGDVEGADRDPTLWIRTSLVSPGWLQIQVEDNGLGIAPEHQTKLFDPFFTTKPVGQGTGLGLSISYQIIVEQHQGELTFMSELGKGTTFSLQIPLGLTHPPAC